MRTIDIQKLSFSYNQRSPVFDEFSLTLAQPIEDGYIFGLMGPSGSGKSTLLKLLLGIEKNFRGTIQFGSGISAISYVPQDPVLFEHLSIKENAEYLSSISIYKNKFARKQFEIFADALGLTTLLNCSKSVTELSGESGSDWRYCAH